MTEESTQGLLYAPTKDGAGYILTGLGKCKDEEILIGSHEGKPVVEISKGAFKGGKFTAITLPPTIRAIGKGAFTKCAELDRVYISDMAAFCAIQFGDGDANPLYYAQRLFLNGEEVTEVEIPEGVSSIAPYAFFRFGALAGIFFPESLTSIGEGAFSGCVGLTSLSFPKGLVRIGKEAFSNCTGLTETLHLPRQLATLGDSAFESCKRLPTVVFYPALQSLGKGAFLGCEALTKLHFYGAMAVWEAAMKSRKKYFPSFTIVTQDDRGVELVFDSCQNVIDVTNFGKMREELAIPEGTQGIATSAFENCDNFRSITIPEGVTFIGKAAFQNCRNLTSVSLPSTVLEICENAFFYCCALDAISLPDGIQKIGANAFNGCSQLSEITIPDSVTEIGKGAFQDCSIETARIGNGVTSLEGFHFGEDLQSIQLGNRIEAINNCAFQKCRWLTSITLPDSVKFIGYRAFKGCTELSSITLPDGIERIEAEAFAETALESTPANWRGDIFYIGKHLIKAKNTVHGILSIRPGIRCIAEEAFSGCAITALTVPDSVSFIGFGAFHGCPLERVVIGNGLESLIAFGFYKGPEKKSLKSFQIGASVRCIGERLFMGCTNLTSINIPKSVMEIGKEAFYSCQAMTHAYFEDTAGWGDQFSDPVLAAKRLLQVSYNWVRK